MKKKIISRKQLFEYARPIIEKIARQRKGQAFAYYEGDDIEQEVWVFCLEALGRFDLSKSSKDISFSKKIEHFLNNHVSNRLKNLMRDRYFRPETPTSRDSNTQVRINLINALPLDVCDIDDNLKVLGSANKVFDPVDFFIAQETLAHIFDQLSDELIDPLIAALEGNKLKKNLEMQLQEAVAEILQELDDE